MTDTFPQAFSPRRRNRVSYSYVGVGNCLGASIPTGCVFEVDPGGEIEVGNIVVVVFKRDSVFGGLASNLVDVGLLGVTKVYLGRETGLGGEPVHLVAQINPPTIVPLPESAIEAMHVVDGWVATQPVGDAGDAQAAMEVLGPFFRKTAAQAPINPDWRPPEREEAPEAIFSCGVLETAAGPTIGTASDVIELLMKSRDALAGKVTGDEAKAPYADALNLALNNNPLFYANLFYVRPALDYLFLDSMRDAISPGYMKRRDRRRWNDYGQRQALTSLDPLG